LLPRDTLVAAAVVVVVIPLIQQSALLQATSILLLWGRAARRITARAASLLFPAGTPLSWVTAPRSPPMVALWGPVKLAVVIMVPVVPAGPAHMLAELVELLRQEMAVVVAAARGILEVETMVPLVPAGGPHLLVVVVVALVQPVPAMVLPELSRVVVAAGRMVPRCNALVAPALAVRW